MNEFLSVLALLMAAALPIIYLYIFGIAHIIDCIARDDGVLFVGLTFIVIFRISYERIAACNVYSLWDFSWIKGNILIFARIINVGGTPRSRKVVLTLRDGWIRYIVAFPRDPVAFSET